MKLIPAINLNLRKLMINSYWTIVTIFTTMLYTATPVLADDNIWDKVSLAVKDVYTQVLGMSTLIAVTAAAIALVIRMISRNQRAVDEATSWCKRIVITWIIINALGFIIAYLQDILQGGQYTAP